MMERSMSKVFCLKKKKAKHFETSPKTQEMVTGLNTLQYNITIKDVYALPDIAQLCNYETIGWGHGSFAFDEKLLLHQHLYFAVGELREKRRYIWYCLRSVHSTQYVERTM